MNSISLVIRREYLERVKRKSFIVTTLLTPLFLLAMMVTPSLIMVMSGPEEQNIAVMDYSQSVASHLQGADGINFFDVACDTDMEQYKDSEDYDAVLVIGADVADNPGDISLYTNGTPSMPTVQFIASQIEDAIQAQRIQRYDIDGLRQILDDINVDVAISTYRLDQEGEEATSTLLSYIIGITMAMMLYMFILIYGQMVMQSIIEEKNSRVLEIVVSSVRPQSLMMGKIAGIGLVAVTQIIIWGVLLICASKWIVPLITGDGGDAELMVALSQLGDPSFIATLFGYMALFFAASFLFYAAIYAAIGSAVDNVQDASQFNIVAMFPIILGIMFSMAAINDPNSSLAFWTSIIPFTSPMVMLARLPFGIPTWEIVLSLALLIASFAAMLWVAAKIYRVGIFMYGKKATWHDLMRWIQYK